MTALQRNRVQRSEHREKVNALLGIEERTPEQEAELRERTGKLQALEVEYRAAVLLEEVEEVREVDGLDSEARERLELRSKATLTGFVLSAMSGRQVSGAEAEFSSACEARGDIPLELFDPDPRQVKAEERVVTSAPGTVGVNIAPIQPHIFAPSIASYLGVDMPRVMSGDLLAGTDQRGAVGRVCGQGWGRRRVGGDVRRLDRDPEAGECPAGDPGRGRGKRRRRQLRERAETESHDGAQRGIG